MPATVSFQLKKKKKKKKNNKWIHLHDGLTVISSTDLILFSRFECFLYRLDTKEAQNVNKHY